MESEKLVRCRNVITGEVVEVPASKLSFRPSVYGVVIKDDCLLLNGFHDGWLLPGGGIDKGETMFESLTREVKEETGLAVTVGKLLDVGEDFAAPVEIPDTYFHTLRFYYACHDPVGEISADGFMDGFEKRYMRIAEWVPRSEAVRIKIYNASNIETLMQKANR